jgi:uncharacterized protein
MTGPRWLYCHGFASGPRSTKGVRLSEHFRARGVALERLDLRVPSLERLSFGAMKSVVVRALGGARVSALVLLAPAFRLAERWRARMTDAEWRAWANSGFLAIHDYAEDRPARVHFDFIRELDAADAGWPDVRVPTLIVHGTDDETVDPQLSRDFARGKSWVRLVEVDDGHELTQSLARIGDEAENFLGGFLGS